MFSKLSAGLMLLRWLIGLKMSYRFFRRCKTKTSLVSRLLSFSRALRQFWLVH